MRQVHITCDRIRYAEFPSLKFGTLETTDYCDVSQYVLENNIPKSINIHSFQKECAYLIIKANKEYDVQPDQMVVINKDNGHQLLIGELALLFLMYADSGFLCHVLERMDEMLINGFVLSDTLVYNTCKQRFSEMQRN